ncbi:ATP synthase F1 subunit delta [Mycoplasma zalophidermidis]|uniref:ATP synthase subunit delta n=1 Tax=Mycoplasma zalophidermidis TaxID=398174 RepID=A0ABS6DSE4_9MOLU|nr:ATP synthase F1 subunit delta [Mycoplasma zalophidermidis]MBU4689802.1 ATP synthase F1 subunit delta [Mycoplasma zalophidermidis]MBU4693947.1 ATP synthase F1 subunit delta [Mycoplasma zalophidermidis]MCR8966573.1 ATP synthase F1 subunit delta [Mycoplasma zalophidermidis]
MYQKANIDGYAIALYELVSENNELAQVHQTLSQIWPVFEEEQNFLKLLANPNIEKETKFDFIDQTFANIPNTELLAKFFKVVVQRRATTLLGRIIKQFFRLSNQTLGIKFAKVYTAFPLSEGRMNKIKSFLEKKYNSKVELNYILKPELLSGFRIEIDSDVIEQNIALDLEKLSSLIIKKGV